MGITWVTREGKAMNRPTLLLMAALFRNSTGNVIKNEILKIAGVYLYSK